MPFNRTKFLILSGFNIELCTAISNNDDDDDDDEDDDDDDDDDDADSS